MKRFFSYFSAFILIGFILAACDSGGSDSSGQNPDPSLENHSPTALPQNVITSIGRGTDITLTGSDVDDDSLIFTIESSPSQGILFGTEYNIIYIPNDNYTGTDSFTFTVNDGKATSTAATVTISINAGDPENAIPDALVQSVTTSQNQATNITLTGTDSDGDSLTFAIASGPSHGILSGTPPAVTYIPNSDYTGSDSFTFTVNDGTATSTAATISININAVDPDNTDPNALAQSVTTLQNQAANITLIGTDSDGDSLTFAIASSPSHGTLSGTPPAVTYTPDSNYTGSDSFTFTANDGKATSTAATVSINIDPGNTAPNALVQFVTTLKNQAANITLTGTDSDGDSLTFAIASDPSHGTLSGTPPAVAFTPRSDYIGTDSFTFTVNDGKATSTAATVTISIPVSDGNGITKISTGPLPGGLRNAPERRSLPHLLGSHKTDDVKVPIRSYFAACDVDTDTPRMYVSLSLEDTGPNANEELPSVGSVMEFIYDKDNDVFKRTGNEATIDLCNESGGITVSSDCSRIGLVCHTAFEEHVSLTEPFTKDLVADASPTLVDEPDNHDQVDSEDDYAENGELWLLEWNNQALSDEPDKYVIHKAVGGIHGGPTGLYYAEDDNSYASTTVSSRFFEGGRHKSASMVVIDRTDWTLFPKTDNRERGWGWNCGEGHVLHVQGFYNPYVNKYGAFCTNDMGYGGSVNGGGGLYIKMEDKGDVAKGEGLYNVASSNTFVTNGGSSYVVPVDADKSLALITAPLYPGEDLLNSFLKYGIIEDAIDDKEIVENNDGTYSDPDGNTLTLDDICYKLEGIDCLQLYFNNGRHSFRENFWSGELQADELTKVGILHVTSNDGSREFNRADKPYENMRWIAEDSDCQLADPQLVDLQNGRYLFGYAKFQCISDGVNLEKHGGARTMNPKKYYILEIDVNGNKLTEPVEIPGTGWGGLDRIISVGKGKAAWAYIPNPEINDDGTYSDPRRTAWEIMVYKSPLGE